MRSMRTLISLCALSLLAACAACSGRSNAPTPTAQPSSPPIADAIRDLLPLGWTIADWRASDDGAWLVAVEQGHTRVGPVGSHQVTTASLYLRGDAGHYVEVGRWADAGTEGLSFGPGSEFHRQSNGSVQFSLKGTSPWPRRIEVVLHDDGTMTTTEVTDALTPETQNRSALINGDPSAPVTPAGSAITPLETPPPNDLTVPAAVVPAGWKAVQATWSPDHEYLAVVTEPDDLGPGSSNSSRSTGLKSRC